MNIEQIKQLIIDGAVIHWINEGYTVILQGDTLYTLFKYNMSMCALQESECKDCFIKGVF